ncbi:MAG: winged helix-turn-helix domain-containing protein [archaeon]|nr:winged helix-turn-helix domain-containing protein [archaeon]
MDIFQVLGNQNRRNIMQILMRKDTHIAALAKELNISNPVALKHVQALEEVGLVEREKIGNTHVIKIRKEAIKKLKQVWSLFDKSLIVEVPKETTLLEALKKVSGLEVEEREDGVYIVGVDGKQGYYTYEINGQLPKESADKLFLKKDCEVELKRLLPIIGKKILIKVK